jgi:hypothetical protein
MDLTIHLGDPVQVSLGHLGRADLARRDPGRELLGRAVNDAP